MKKIIVIIALSAIAAVSVFAQESEHKTTIRKGDFSFGVNINPVTLFGKSNWKPEDGAFSGAFVDGVGKTPKQMYILSQDPVASFKIRYHMSESVALRAQFGFTGSVINQKDYVQDDKAVYLNPDSENKVIDQVTSRLNAASLGLALEFIKGSGSLKFNGSIGLLYAIAGGEMTFSYGNPFDKDYNGFVPTSTAYTQKLDGVNKVADDLNEGGGIGKLGIVYSRPTKRFNAGYTNAIGLTLDMGIEWFFTGRMSLGAALTFTPIMVMFQPQTYTQYEAYTTIPISGGSDDGGVITYNDMVSPGSTGLIYGTDNLGFRLSLNYYL